MVARSEADIPFIDLKTQQLRIRGRIDAAISRVLDHGAYIMGPEVFELEAQLARFCGVKHALSCANGTDALMMALMAKNVGAGDAVFVPSFTFAATAEVVALVGATPVFVDSLPDTFNMDVQSLKLGIQRIKELGLRPVGIIAVDMFGLPADYDAIQVLADENKLWLIADAAQSFGATYKGRHVGNIGDIATTSFFPAKPLGCYGDGGAIFTNDDEVAETIKSIRVHGQGSDKYDNVRIGMNGRLDTIQAAILIEKLAIFPEELEARQRTAMIYEDGLKGSAVITPKLPQKLSSAWAQYTLRLPSSMDRGVVMSELKKERIPSVIYYPKPLHQQTAYKGFPTAGKKPLPQCEKLASEVLSLPMSPYVLEEDAKQIARILNRLP